MLLVWGWSLTLNGAMRLFREIDVGSEVVDENGFMAWFLKHCLLEPMDKGSESYYFLAE
jgi:hypothetical protein